ncbi:MAG: tetratricopeptide repeat protein [Gammaproteobacteria bacterium]|jgi:tetratricopeptide (TPR) repeat protein
MPTLFFRVFLLVLGFLTIAPSYAAAGDADFQAGIAAFRSGNYNQAIIAFERARRKGKHSSDLYYNLGVSYYKSGQYQNSETAFRKLLNDKNFRQLAAYNLGLVALAQKRKEDAITWFRKAAASHDNKKVTALARHMLDKYAPRKSAHHINGLLSLGYGHNSNVTLVSTGSPTQQGDNYAQLFGFISLPAGRVLINASLFVLNYQTVNSADFSQLSAGVIYPLTHHKWLLLPGLSLNKDKLDHSDFITVTNLQLTASRPLFAKSKLKLRYRYSDISADAASYTYLQGSRQQFRVQATRPTPWGRLRVRYELELNNRRNLSTANYSPTRHTLLARLRQLHDHGWRTQETVSWRQSHYGAVAGVSRDDNRYELVLSADTRFGTSWRGGVRYTYSDNQSNLANETYTRNDLQAYLQRLF